MSGFRWDMDKPVGGKERLLMCSDCGAAVPDRGIGAHDWFHHQISQATGIPVRRPDFQGEKRP